MKNIKYKIITDEKDLVEKINKIDKIARLHLLKIKELYAEDLYFLTLIDKSIKLIDTFLFALNKRNITVLATLTRVQMDCAMRAFASTLVENSTEFCNDILLNNTRINKIKDSSGNKLTDRYLCEKLGDYLNLPVYELYEKVCGFVHFSFYSFYSITKANDKKEIEMYISRENRADEKEEFERLSIELANQFCFLEIF